MAQTLDPNVPAQLARKANSPARWLLAAERAATNGLQAFCIGGDPRLWAVTSGSCPGAAYVVEIRPGEAPSCMCPAATKGGDAVCQHRAYVLRKLGMLPVAPSQPANVTPLPVSYAAAD